MYLRAANMPDLREDQFRNQIFGFDLLRLVEYGTLGVVRGIYGSD